MNSNQNMIMAGGAGLLICALVGGSVFVGSGQKAEMLKPGVKIGGVQPGQFLVESLPSTSKPRASSVIEASVPVTSTDSPSTLGDGMFPHYGNREVLPGVTLKELAHADLSVDEMSAALKKVHRISRELTQETYRSNPEVRESFLTLDEAIDLREQGFLVMKGDDPLSDGGTRYFVCPDSRAAQLDELKTVGMLLYNQHCYVEHASERLRSSAKESPRAVGELRIDVRQDGTGIDLWNAAGEPVSWKRYNIPGLVTGFLPPT